MKKLHLIFAFLLILVAQPGRAQGNRVTQLTKDAFLQKVHNFKTNSSWKYLGSKPALIDFYAVWCGPCKQLSPIVEEVAKAHPELVVYKVNVDEQPELAEFLKVSSIPVLLYVPMKGLPKSVIGFQSREEIEQQLAKILPKAKKKS